AWISFGLSDDISEKNTEEVRLGQQVTGPVVGESRISSENPNQLRRNSRKQKDKTMSSKTTTKVGPNTYRETVRYNSGGGKSTVYKPGFIFRDVKSTTR